MSILRKVIRPITLATPNGRPLALPPGTICVSPAWATHRDPQNYANPDTFEPWRFAGPRAEIGDGAAGGAKQQQFVSTGPAYIPFGLGKHAWYVRLSLRRSSLSVYSRAAYDLD